VPQITSYTWYLNGSQVSTLQTYSPTFTTAGYYSVRLVVADDEGSTAERTQTVFVNQTQSIQWQINGVDRVDSDEFQETFQAYGFYIVTLIAQDYGNTSTRNLELFVNVNRYFTYLWNFAGLGYGNAAEEEFTFRELYINPVSLTVTDNLGAVSSITRDVYSFIEFIWDFGDGVVLKSPSAIVAHQYYLVGYHTVTLRQYDSIIYQRTDYIFIMSHNTYLYGVRIYLEAAVTSGTQAQREAVGIYTDQIRWVERTLQSVAGGSWASGIFIKNGFGDIKQKADFSKGGNVAQAMGVSFRVRNTDQLYLRLEEFGVNLHGLRCEVVEFVGSTGNDDSVSSDVIFSGVVDNVEWDETAVSISTISSRIKRDGQILSVVNSSNYPNANSGDIGKVIPATFGKIDNAKFVRTAKVETIIQNDGGYTPSGLKAFHISSAGGGYGDRQYTVRVGVSRSGSGMASLAGKFMRVLSGGWYTDSTHYGDMSGQMREIESSTVIGSPDTDKIYVVLKDFFPHALSGNSTATANNQAWVEFVDIANEYTADVWPLNNYLDSADDPTDEPDVAVYDNEFVSIPNVGVGATDKNKITIDNKQLLGSETIDSIKIIPVAGCGLWAGGMAAIAKTAGEFSTFTNNPDTGIYQSTNFQSLVINSHSTTGSLAQIIDKNTATEISSVLISTTSDGSNRTDFYKVFYFDPPAIDGLTQDFDSVSFLLDISSLIDREYSSFEGSGLFVRVIKWAGYSECVLDDSIGAYFSDFNDTATIKTFPDFYYGGSVDNSEAYYTENSITADTNSITGATRFVLPGIDSKEKYKSIYKILVGIVHQVFQPFELTIKIKEAAFAFRKTLTLNSDIFSKVQGRNQSTRGEIEVNWSQGGSPKSCLDRDLNSPPASPTTGDAYIVPAAATGDWFSQRNQHVYWTGSAWNGYTPSLGNVDYVADEAKYVIWTGTEWRITRKQPGDMITTPVEILEHAKRLQNWSESSATETLFGTAYSAAALIKTTGTGSFDDASLGDSTYNDSTHGINSLRPGRQIFDETDGRIDAITKSLCDTFGLCSYIDNAGYECVRPVFSTIYSAGSPCPDANKISFADCIGQIGDVKEPNPSDVIVAPQLSYNWNYGAEKFDGVIAVQKANFSAPTTWDAAAIADRCPGFPTTTQILGNPTKTDAQVVWEKCRALWLRYRAFSQSSTNQSQAKWITRQNDAIWRINLWVDSMAFRRLPVTVSYEKGRLWQVAEHLVVQLPHQTDDIEVEAVIESISKNKNRNIVTVTLVLLQSIATNFY
jgi:hypothetical protein